MVRSRILDGTFKEGDTNAITECCDMVIEDLQQTDERWKHLIKELRVDWVDRYWSLVKTVCQVLKAKLPKRGGESQFDTQVFNVAKTLFLAVHKRRSMMKHQ